VAATFAYVLRFRMPPPAFGDLADRTRRRGANSMTEPYLDGQMTQRVAPRGDRGALCSVARNT
jgi:hypothetical protein